LQLTGPEPVTGGDADARLNGAVLEEELVGSVKPGRGGGVQRHIGGARPTATLVPRSSAPENIRMQIYSLSRREYFRHFATKD
jgi:hypothetical protein